MCIATKVQASFFRQVSAKFLEMLRGTTNFPTQVIETMKENGAWYRDRTCDPYHVKVVLYR